MLFAKTASTEVDDGAVLEHEWQTLMSHARADRVKLARQLREGMSIKTLQALHVARKINLRLLTDTGLVTVEDWDAAVEVGRTQGRLSDVLLRYLRIQTMASEIWSHEKAATWLQRANRALDGESPVSLLDSDQGAQAVETLLGQIAHGIAS